MGKYLDSIGISYLWKKITNLVNDKHLYFENVNDMYKLGVSANADNTELYDEDHQITPISGTPGIPYNTICYIKNIKAIFTKGNFIGLSIPLRLKQLITTITLDTKKTVIGNHVYTSTIDISNYARNKKQFVFFF